MCVLAFSQTYWLGKMVIKNKIIRHAMWCVGHVFERGLKYRLIRYISIVMYQDFGSLISIF